MSEIVESAGQAQAPSPTGAPTAEQPAPQEAPKASAQSLAEAIRQNRADREAKAAKEREAADWKAKYEELAARQGQELDPVKDPIAWAKARKLDAATQALVGQSLLYDLVPDKAPQDFRVKLLESKIAREAQEREAREAEARTRQAQEAATRQLNEYTQAVTVAAKSFAPGSHPESEAWFGEDQDTYTRSLLATARNLAETAQRTGQQANLDPTHVAGVLEAEIARKMKVRDERRGGSASKSQAETQKGGGEQTAGNVFSPRGLTGSGTSRPQAQNDKERVERAIKAAFSINS